MMTIEATLQEMQEALDVERDEQAQVLANAREHEYNKPYRNKLQLDYHCCRCGILLPAGKLTIICHLPMRVGVYYTSQMVVWCDQDWAQHFGTFGDIKEVENT